jgi:hypothetical protein
MRNYKAFGILAIVSIVLTILSVLFSVFRLEVPVVVNVITYWLVFLVHLLVILSLIITLKNFNENNWRIIPFVVSMILSIINFTFFYFLLHLFTRPMSMIYYVTINSYIFMLLNMYIATSCFFVKRLELSVYFKMYAGAVVVAMLFNMAFSFALNLVIHQPMTGLYIREAVGMLPTIAIIILYRSLYDSITTFKEGDLVIAKRVYENVPFGNNGIVTAIHPGYKQYEVEFFDQDGESLNLLIISGEDMEHIQA